MLNEIDFKKFAEDSRIARCALYLAVMFFLLSLYFQYTNRVQQLDLPTPPPVSTQPIHHATTDISTLHLFGEYIDTAASDAPETTLSLVLHGVLSAGGKGQGSAIISANEASDKVYNVGDLLPGNATLEHVYPDKIILSHQGKLETLMLPKHLSDHQRF